MSPRACSGALARCTGMARRRGQRTLRGNIIRGCALVFAPSLHARSRARARVRVLQVLRRSAAQHKGAPCLQRPASQRSLHNAPIFRLLLKVAVNGTHQCGFFNFCGAFRAPTCCTPACARASAFATGTVIARVRIWCVLPRRRTLWRAWSRSRRVLCAAKHARPLSDQYPCGRGNSAISDA